ncbi:hypothetical protein SAMN02745221_00134 [Thermosyntropha lipolytica DSM 11003]|uniref:Uncharacterized protein n=1 Tax=Thermosyntropha lipolytica DSM 11003 TaxID=1123382 RepID=A0A1M5JI90_9FIRM|nr:hypothetical protein [Thermosyntropha lipolytica]SHG40251.1 hypothetical protein SAMN02745221_00134 [Thermosyntropha lipolytica DSM 11003]
MIPSSLVFVYTYKCNFNCIHCSLSCKPANNDVIWEEIVYKVIDQAYYIPLGRARKKCSIDMFIPGNNNEVFQPCREAGKALTVLPDGNITFCCGHILNTKAQDFITIANIIRDNITLSQIINRMQRNVLFWLLYLEGPLSIFNRLNISYPVYRKCEACYLLATKYLRQLHKLADHKEAIWQEVKEEKINVISA